MANFDPRYARLHKEIYSKRLDELDTEIVKRIMENPACEEAILLNRRVDAEIRERLEPVLH